MAKHMTVAFYTRRASNWFRKRYWVECLYCNAYEGPMPDVEDVNAARRRLDSDDCPGAK